MTEAGIIKALECCKNDDCDNCPNNFGNCYANLAGYALDLINRQKAEIERLLNLARSMHTWIFLHTGDEAEAYKECGLTDEDNTLLGYVGKCEIEIEGDPNAKV